MKFSQLYPELKPMDTVQEKSLLVCHDEKPCAVCGCPTNFVDFCSEGRLCSEECYESYFNRMNVVCNEFPDSIGMKDVALAVEDYSDKPTLETLSALSQKVYDANAANGVSHEVFTMKVARLYPSVPNMEKDDFAKYARDSVKEIVSKCDDRVGTHSRLTSLYAHILSVAYNRFNPDGKPLLDIMKILRGNQGVSDD